ncbi:MAG TPA: TlpA disulfide reductase family protein [Bryobacteraceae bacterium]|nr:TlpA disulfide reductase family protein [Bryobacteraceae bacterium]
MVGHSAPPLELKHWLNSRPLEMSDLRGKVVLLRWWTEGCPFCTATAPALLKLQREYGPRGFVVIGVYHPKPPGDWDMSKVERAVKEKGFTFPVALDGDWSALKRWWLDQPRDFTSVSFLVDKKGIIRYVSSRRRVSRGRSRRLRDPCELSARFSHHSRGHPAFARGVNARASQRDRSFWKLRLTKDAPHAGHANSGDAGRDAIYANDPHFRTMFSHNQLVRRERFIRGEHRIPRHSEQLRPNPRRAQPRAALNLAAENLPRRWSRTIAGATAPPEWRSSAIGGG